MKETVPELFNRLILGGKTLKELNFPEEWEYDVSMCRWKSEKHTFKTQKLSSKKEPEQIHYVYITNELLSRLSK